MRDLLIYDGECGICTVLAKWAERKSKQKFHIIPYQSFDLSSISIEYSTLEKSAVFFRASDKKLFRNARSVFETLKHLHFPFNIFGFLLANPVASGLAYPTYRIIAGNRRWISIKLGFNACKL